MVVETHTPMQCPDCNKQILHIQIDDFSTIIGYQREESIVDPEPIESSNAGITYQIHECDNE